MKISTVEQNWQTSPDCSGYVACGKAFEGGRNI